MIFLDFDGSTNHVMITLFTFQDGEVYYVKGAIERVLRNCTKYHHRGSELPMNSNQEHLYLHQAAELGRMGLRGESATVYKQMYFQS